MTTVSWNVIFSCVFLYMCICPSLGRNKWSREEVLLRESNNYCAKLRQMSKTCCFFLLLLFFKHVFFFFCNALLTVMHPYLMFRKA